jgi:hypothetical protein
MFATKTAQLLGVAALVIAALAAAAFAGIIAI